MFNLIISIIPLKIPTYVQAI